MKYLLTIATIFLYVLLLIPIYMAYINFVKVNVVLFASIFCSLIALALLTLFLIILKKFQIFSLFEKILIISICGLIGYSLALSLPTVIDRSLSFYILEKLNQRGGGIHLDKMNLVFTKEYILEHKLIDVRITEQLETKTVKIENNCLKLTTKGQKLVKFSRFFRKYFLPKKRLIRNKYSNDLIDPFKNGDFQFDYKCN